MDFADHEWNNLDAYLVNRHAVRSMMISQNGKIFEYLREVQFGGSRAELSAHLLMALPSQILHNVRWRRLDHCHD